MLHGVTRPSFPVGNLLLSILPRDELKFIQPHLESISLPSGHVYAEFCDPLRQCFFPNNGVISLLSVTYSGLACEVGYIGFEGMVGLPVVFGKNEMPYQALVQANSDGFRVPLKIVTKLFRRKSVFHDAALRFTYVLFRQFAQTSACNRFHDIQSRLCRWLAIMYERSGDTKLILTQEFLAYILGVQRTSIAAIANNLQNEGIIRYARGKIEVVDIERLKESACECLSAINDEYEHFLSEEKKLRMSATRQTRG